jgi:predicted lipoprotein with Yx(FWY)xxD motif
MRQGHGGANRGWRFLAAGATVVMVGGLLITTTASAQVASAKNKPVKMVKETVRSTFGEILTNQKMHTLYIEPGGTCTGSCLVIWPPLLMPKGKTMPAGVPSGLGTVAMGSRRQVTYEGMPLYTFYQDTKTSTSGENLGGFVVAQVSSPT